MSAPSPNRWNRLVAWLLRSPKDRRLQQLTLIAAPPILLATTSAVYQAAAARLGKRLGYLVGFVFYWGGWCILLPLAAVGPDGLRRMFAQARPTRTPAWLRLVLLLGPVVAPFLGTFRREAKQAGPQVLAASALFGLVNGTLEEVLWRGTYTTAFPDSKLWGYLYPSVWFGLWHLAPQTVFPSKGRGGALAFALMAIFLGLSWGWVAQEMGSIRWTVAAHTLNNFMALGGKLFTLAPDLD